MVRRSLGFVGALSLLAAVAGPIAIADAAEQRVVTVNNRYIPGDASVTPLPPITLLRGDNLLHTNNDSEPHDLISDATGPNGQPYFDSELIGTGESARVPVENLAPGVYLFTCSIHPFMHGSLDVKGTPAPPEPAQPGDTQVASGENYFAPKTLTVPVGTSVRWRNAGQISHSVTASDGSWDSHPACPTAQCMAPGETFSKTFNATGVFRYYCKLHGTPGGTGHAGTLTVVPPGSTPTSVDGLGVSKSGLSVNVNGSATFGGEPPVTVSEDTAGDAPAADLADDTGVDLVSAAAYQPDPAIPSLFFEWRVTGLPQTGSLPEAIRYTLPFKIGTKQFQLQAKLSNVGSVTVVDDPQGHPAHVGNAFQLRGNCVANYPQAPVPLANCPHLAWLGGTFDAANKIVRIKVPLGITPEFAPGAVLERNVSTNTSLVQISATYQAVASSGTTTGDVSDWGSDDDTFKYAIPKQEVRLGLTPAGTPVEQVGFGTASTLSGSSFTGSLTAPGPGTYDLWARACFGTSCGTRKTTVTV